MFITPYYKQSMETVIEVVGCNQKFPD